MMHECEIIVAATTRLKFKLRITSADHEHETVEGPKRYSDPRGSHMAMIGAVDSLGQLWGMLKAVGASVGPSQGLQRRL